MFTIIIPNVCRYLLLYTIIVVYIGRIGCVMLQAPPNLKRILVEFVCPSFVNLKFLMDKHMPLTK